MSTTRTRYRTSRSSNTVVLLFVVAVITLAYLNEPFLVSRVQQISIPSFTTQQAKQDKFPFPDFNKYIHTQTLSPKEFGLGAHDERVIIVGDTHGMNRSLHNLLSTVRYEPHKDTLFLAGDILAKSTEAGSLAILDFFAQHRSMNCASGRRHPNPTPSDSRKGACKPVYAVRGNHDQMIVQWRAWRDWFEDLQLAFPSAHLHPGHVPPPALASFASMTSSASYDAGPPVGSGSQFLALIESEWLADRTNDPKGPGSDVEEWVDTARKRAAGTWRAEWWKRIPRPGKGRASKDWIMFGDHYWIARDMKPEHARVLYSLPLVIHVPSEHFFLVHAGILPSDPRRASNDKHQPLAHPPSSDDGKDHLPEEVADYDHAILDVSSDLLSPFATMELDDEIEELRVVQERSVLQNVPQNRDPWSLLNMRGVRKNGKVTRLSDKGTPWSKIWNSQMKRCVGFKKTKTGALADLPGEDEDDAPDRDGDAVPLPCYPSTVVYGHAASRDLDVRRWTVGLDTGCLYGRRLTALVLTHSQDDLGVPTRTAPAGDDDDDEEESSDEEEDEFEIEDEYSLEGPFEDVNTRFSRVAGGSAVSRARRPKTWTRTIKFGDKDSDLDAKLVSIKCPKVADLS